MLCAVNTRPILRFDCGCVSATCMVVPHLYSEDGVSSFYRNFGTAYTVTSQKTVCYGHFFSSRYRALEREYLDQYRNEAAGREGVLRRKVCFPSKCPDRLWSPTGLLFSVTDLFFRVAKRPGREDIVFIVVGSRRLMPPDALQPNLGL